MNVRMNEYEIDLTGVAILIFLIGTIVLAATGHDFWAALFLLLTGLVGMANSDMKP